MEKLQSVLIAILMVLVCVVPSVYAFSGSGAGTVGDPYQITTCGQFNESANPSSATHYYYKFMNDIDCLDYGWNPVQMLNTKTPYYDGNYKTVSNLYISTTTHVANYGSGIFHYLAAPASTTVFRNMTFKNVTALNTPSGAGNSGAGIISAYVSTHSSSITLQNVMFDSCKVKLNAGSNTDEYRVGIVMGSAMQAGILQNVSVFSSNAELITAGDSEFSGLGGVIGTQSDGYLYNIYSNSTVTFSGGGDAAKGSIVGYNAGGTNASNYYDSTFSSYSSSGFGAATATGESTSNMNIQGTYSGWDFTNIWKMSTSTGNYKGYPILMWIDESVAPVASFTKDETGGRSPVVVTFTDTSINTPTSWYWVFGDGSSTNSTLQNPVHAFTGSGVYNVNLTVTNSKGSSTSATQSITVSDPPVASFTKIRTGGLAPLTMVFTDTSTYTPTSWYWVFGDGSSTNSTVQNPVHTYTLPGQYYVNLTVTNADGSNISALQSVVAGSEYAIIYAANDASLSRATAGGEIYTNYVNGVGNAAPVANGTTSMTAAYITSHASVANQYIRMFRYAVNFDTAFLKQDAQIGSALLRIKGVSKSLTFVPPGKNQTALLLGNARTSRTFIMGDYQNVTLSSGELAPRIDYTSITTGNMNSTFNEYGLTKINRTTFTTFYIVDGDQVDGAFTGTWSATKTRQLLIEGAADSTTANRPFLEMYYTSIPTATFTKNSTGGTSPLTVQFNDTSIHIPISWYWVFGDGTTSTVRNATHTFTGAGTYGVNLTATNVAGSETSAIQNVVVGVPPVATFTMDTHITYAPHTAIFTFTGSGADSYVWSFGDGDGTNQTQMNPVHTYASNNNYTATVYATNIYGSTLSAPQYLELGNIPTSSYTKDKTNVAVSEVVTFTDTSTGSPTGWNWTITNSTQVSSLQNPTFSFPSTGIYGVRLNATTKYGGIPTAYQNVIVGDTPVASFTKNETVGFAPLGIAFTDTSTNLPTSWYWVFGDGSVSTLQNPTHSYPIAGVYNANLTAYNTYGSTTSATQAITSNIHANFTGTPITGLEPLQNVTFTDLSNGTPTSWDWSFGDGATSTEQNPMHTYSVIGLYTVSLNIHKAGLSSDTLVRNDYIDVHYAIPAGAGWTANVTSGTGIVPNGVTGWSLPVKFTPTWTGGTPTSFDWYIAGAHSTSQYPVATFVDSGVYRVNVSITNSQGNSTYNGTYSVVGTPPMIIGMNIGAGSSIYYPPTPNIAFGVSYDDISHTPPATFLWNFGDGTTSPLQNPTHSFINSGTFDVSVTETNPWGTDVEHQSYTVLTAPYQAVSIVKWVDADGATITSAYKDVPVSFSFDTVSAGHNPPPGYIGDYFALKFYKKDVSTGNWILESGIPVYAEVSGSPPFSLYHVPLQAFSTNGATSRWVGYSDMTFADEQTYRAILTLVNTTSSVTYPTITLGTADIAITSNPLKFSNLGEWANSVGGIGLKLIIAALIVLGLVAAPFILMRAFNPYIEVIMAILGIGFGYYLGLLDLWIIFGLGVIAAVVIFFMYRGGGGGAVPVEAGGEAG